jgi:hypothetical protein
VICQTIFGGRISGLYYLYVETMQTVFWNILACFDERSVLWDGARAKIKNFLLNCCPWAFDEFVSERELVIGVVVSVVFLFGVAADVGVVMCFELGWKSSLGIGRAMWVRSFRVVELVRRFISVMRGGAEFLC